MKPQRPKKKAAEKILTLTQVCKRLAASETSVMRWVRQGRLQGLRYMRHWRFEERAVRDFLREARETADGAKSPRTYSRPRRPRTQHEQAVVGLGLHELCPERYGHLTGVN